MSIDDDLARFNNGLDDLFTPKPIKQPPQQLIRHQEQKVPWHKRRTRRTQSDVYSMVSSYPHHEGDRKWLVNQMQSFPYQKREPAMMEYGRRYASFIDGEHNENTKEGHARKAANTWLVDVIETISKT